HNTHILHHVMITYINYLSHRHLGYTGMNPGRHSLSLVAAISQPAHDTLVALYPSQTLAFDARLAEDLAHVRNPSERVNGVALGHRVATAILAMRLNDGSQIPEPVFGTGWTMSKLAGDWGQDPIGQ